MVSFITAKVMEFLEKWIKENGLVEVDKGDDYVICREGNNTVMYRGLYLEIPTEGDVAKEIALMAKDRVLYNKYYIVTTPEVVNFIDGGLIKKLGIGVMVADDSSIKEVMRSIPIETTPSRGRDADQRIEHLERVINTLEGKVKELEDKLNQLTQVVNELRRGTQRGEETARTGVMEQGVNVQVPDNVPSFIKDNPWLGILMSKSEST
ncbi:hypothetical protein [Caldivirga maquilingensis]|uniref:Uncharacterized protein n=1 Tax=Caldivirga maquilingensis (strain ATCC 700844 / DSM 13496 / JCM 10307 / IC-167) TaxID=397948 RepID=A8MDJ9_CALMQ|nr:hypothetical protein [Caldivirga maquilingensis]ABW01855.1 hypothetical protein Cmaq_1024 [Caldivirga maquilingensis IC-167]